MAKMSIKRKRTLQYFIDAAKEIIEKEGVKQVTARKVGELSGYSYATIYNYFKDLKELLAYCALDYLKACSKDMLSIDTEGLDIVSIIQKYNTTYFKFFAKNPQIFQLVFLEDLDDYPTQLITETSEPAAGYLLLEHLKKFADKGFIKEKDITTIHQLNIASVHGKLLFFNNNRDVTTMLEIIEILKKEVEFMIGGVDQ
jgi:AcrR family transcriptional regulator